MIIAIDGPAGAGKGTLSKNLVKKFGFHYLDTGALFRAVGLALVNDNQLTDDNLELKAEFYSKNLDFQFTRDFKILLDGKDVSNCIRTPATAMMASKVAALPKVRENLDLFQKEFARKYRSKGVILDGRDMGTFIAPDAPVKVFLDCSATVRAERRVAQLAEKSIETNFDDVLADIVKRDEQDRNRKIRPLKAANDALQINTCECSIEKVLEIVSQKIEKLIEDKKKGA